MAQVKDTLAAVAQALLDQGYNGLALILQDHLVEEEKKNSGRG